MTYLSNAISSITSSTSGSVYVADANLGNVNAIFDGRLSYTKGGFVLRMIKWILGDAAFYQAIKEYHDRPQLAYGYAGTTDLKNSLLQSTGKDFTEFFNDWIYGQGYPTYQIRWNQTTDKVIRFNVKQTQSHSSVSFFEMPLPIKVTGTAGEIAYLVLDNTTNNQNFANQLNFTVATVQFNYEYQIIHKGSTVTKDTAVLAVENSGHDVTKVYPNPVKDVLSVSGIAKDSKYEIYSLDGKLIKQGMYNSASKINVNNLSKGTYLIKIGESNLKFIKQ